MIDEDKLIVKAMTCPHCRKPYSFLLQGMPKKGELCPNCGTNVFVTAASLKSAGFVKEKGESIALSLHKSKWQFANKK